MVNPNYTKLEESVIEKTTPELTAVIKDVNNVIVSSANLTSMTLTYYVLNDGPTYTIINNRDGQDVLNANNVTIDGSGNLKWILQEVDTAIIFDTNNPETHRAVFRFAYTSASGPKVGKYIIDFTIINLERVV